MLYYGMVVTVSTEGGPQLDYCLRNLRSNAPKCPIRVVSDGVDDPTYADICRRHSATYTLGSYLRRIECGGAWWERTLREGLATDCDWFVRVDPDTRFWRKPKTAPRYPVAGSLLNVGEIDETIGGGCQSFTRAAAERIVGSDLVRSSELTELWNLCPDKDQIHLYYPMGYLSLDYSLIYILRALGIEFGPWSEVGCRARVAPPNFNFQYAVTHPHKLADSATQGVPANTPLRLITTCMGRLDHLKQTLPLWLEQSHTLVTVVDYSCPQGTADWVESLKDSRVSVVRVPGKTRFNLSAARNAGARHAARYLPEGRAELSPELWAFIDADILVQPHWADEVRRTFKEGHYHIAGPLTRNMGGTVVLRPASYFCAGGYDDVINGWGPEDTLFYACLRASNVRPALFPGEYVSAIRHNDHARTKNYATKDKHKSNVIADNYYRLKIAYMLKCGYLPAVAECREFYDQAMRIYEASVHAVEPWAETPVVCGSF